MSAEPTARIVGTPHRVPIGNRNAAKIRPLSERLIAGASIVNGVPQDTLKADILTVLEYVSRGRGYVDCAPYPDFQARRALGAIHDQQDAADSAYADNLTFTRKPTET